MINLIHQGKIIRHFWGKLIRQSTYSQSLKTPSLQYVTWGAVFILKHKRQFTCRLSNKITFFYYDIRAG